VSEKGRSGYRIGEGGGGGRAQIDWERLEKGGDGRAGTLTKISWGKRKGRLRWRALGKKNLYKEGGYIKRKGKRGGNAYLGLRASLNGTWGGALEHLP